MDTIIEDESPRARLALLLKHFSELDDDREAWRILYPIEEVLLLVTCATIASCADFDDTVAWRRHHVASGKGVGLNKMTAEIFGKKAGLAGGRGGHRHLLDPAVNFACSGIIA